MAADFFSNEILFATFASWTGTTEQPDGSGGRMPGLTEGRADGRTIMNGDENAQMDGTTI